MDEDGTPNYLDLDSDNDGFSDAEEFAAGTNPFSASSYPGSLPLAAWPLAALLLMMGIQRMRRA